MMRRHGQIFFILGFVSGMALLTGNVLWSKPASGSDTTTADGKPNMDVDIESVREPGATTKLFAPQPTPTPPSDAEEVPGVPRNRNLPGDARRSNSGRANDLAADRAASDPLAVRVAYRRAKTLALERDPELSALVDQARMAKTDVQKRAYLKEYYTRLLASISKIDHSPEMKRHVAVIGRVVSQRYDPQRRVVGGEEDLVNGRGGGRRSRAQ